MAMTVMKLSGQISRFERLPFCLITSRIFSSSGSTNNLKMVLRAKQDYSSRLLPFFYKKQRQPSCIITSLLQQPLNESHRLFNPLLLWSNTLTGWVLTAWLIALPVINCCFRSSLTLPPTRQDFISLLITKAFPISDIFFSGLMNDFSCWFSSCCSKSILEGRSASKIQVPTTQFLSPSPISNIYIYLSIFLLIK